MIFALVKAYHAAHKYIDKSVYTQYNKSKLVFLTVLTYIGIYIEQ